MIDDTHLPKACSACPWRLSNQGTPHPLRFYGKANLKRLWDGLRTGRAPGMTCHATDPRKDLVEDAGALGTHECGGAVILVAREVMRFQAYCNEADQDGEKDGLRRYRRAVPRGLTRDGMAAAVWRFIAGGTPLARSIKLNADSLNDQDVGLTGLPWDASILERAQQ